MSSPDLDKQALRLAFRRKRATLSEDFKTRANACVAEHLSHFLSEHPTHRRIAAYLASPDEVDLKHWMRSAWADDREVCVPVLSATAGQMAFYAMKPETPLRQGRFKLREPVVQASDAPTKCSELDVALVPLLAFDDNGHRLGMGGGYYDRYFAEANHRPLIIGVSFDTQKAEHTLPTEPWDILLDGVVTETGFRLFRS